MPSGLAKPLSASAPGNVNRTSDADAEVPSSRALPALLASCSAVSWVPLAGGVAEPAPVAGLPLTDEASGRTGEKISVKAESTETRLAECGRCSGRSTGVRVLAVEAGVPSTPLPTPPLKSALRVPRKELPAGLSAAGVDEEAAAWAVALGVGAKPPMPPAGLALFTTGPEEASNCTRMRASVRAEAADIGRRRSPLVGVLPELRIHHKEDAGDATALASESDSTSVGVASTSGV